MTMTSQPGIAWLFPGEPSAAQVVLGTIAGSMMTVVSVVYSILLVALSLASMQFSTGIVWQSSAIRRAIDRAVAHARLVRAGARESFAEDDCAELRARHDAIASYGARLTPPASP